jgi:glycosyltransferase involved in cell wall biosynthesis
MASRRLKVVYALDAVGTQFAGGLRAGLRVVERLREDHDAVLLGAGAATPGLVALRAVQVPFASALLAKHQFTFARPDDAVIARALEGADLVHVQLPFWLGHRAITVARRLGVPVVVSHHVQPENLLHNVGLRCSGLAGLLNRWLVRSFYDRADVVVCPTRFSRQELVRSGLTAPAVVISNGMPERFRPAPRPPSDGTFTVLTVGRLASEKRQALLIDAVLRSKHRARIRLVIAGKGPLEQRLRQRARPLEDRVQLGFVPDDALLALYQRADLYVHASDVELEGLTVLEAGRCGCPTLISDSRSSAAGELALGEEWLFEAGNAWSLATRLDHWLEHPDLLEQARARTLARTVGHGIDRTVTELERVYQWVAARGRRFALPASQLQPGRMTFGDT